MNHGSQQLSDRWEELFSQSSPQGLSEALRSYLHGKNVLITGAGGCIGAALARAVASAKPGHLVLLDHSEEHIYNIASQVRNESPTTPMRAVVGAAGDANVLDAVFSAHSIEIIYHAAAYKHVPLMELNPLVAIANNTLTTRALAIAASRFGVPNLIMISTDKAVEPASIMGVSKRLAEMVLLRLSSAASRMSAVRFGNVFGSSGSVVPLFLEQISAGGPITITHRDASRYFVTLAQCSEIVLTASALPHNGSIFVPHMEEPLKILDLAHRLISRHGREDSPISFIGLRAGEKLTEKLVAKGETEATTSSPLLFQITAAPTAGSLDSDMRALERATSAGDLGDALEIICSLVPEYRPSDLLLSAAKASIRN